MSHFEGKQSTTEDVVRHAIIPLSRDRSCAYAEIMMSGHCVQPDHMVTHNWSNLFRDLVAAILADALDEVEYGKISYMLDNTFEQLEAWVQAAKLGQRSYWVCAFCVNQHMGICGQNPHYSTDAVTGAEHPTCSCGIRKVWNDTAPTLGDNRSIPCEMNKFDDMIEFLSASNQNFCQVIAVDAMFVLFSRAWCVAEVAAAHKMGMRQSMKMVSRWALSQHEEELKGMRIEHMEATRKDDKEEILAKIPSHAEFNQTLQALLFSDLLVVWRTMERDRRLDCAGKVIRWQRVDVPRQGPDL